MVAFPRRLKDAIKRPLERRFGRVEMSRAYEIVLNPDYRPLAGQTAVVTGASGAIGRAVAIRLAADGAHVIAVARNRNKLQELVHEITALGGSASFMVVDLTNASAVHDCASRLGPINILVNNAGGSARGNHAHIWEQATETIDEVLTVNLRAAIITTAAFGSGMLSNPSEGRIINVGSTVAVGGLARFSEYAGAKAGIVGFTRSAALEFGPHGITVNCVTPGIVQRGQIRHEAAELIVKKGVLPRLGRAEDIAECITFLAGPRGGWITGQELIVDGGRSIGLHGES
jgi:3-oxoacyl-[acyl-carrier protein] reductase